MKHLTSHELRQLASDGPAGRRAAREIRDRRAADTLTLPKLAALESVRAMVAELDGDHRLEIEVLDELLAARGVFPEDPSDAARSDQSDDQGPAQAGRRPRRPFETSW